MTRERLDPATQNFDSSLRLISCMFISNFEAIGPVTLVLGPKNRPKKFCVKSGLIQKRLKYGKNISYGYMS